MSVCLSQPGALLALPADMGVCLLPHWVVLSFLITREWQQGEFDLGVRETAWLSAFPFLSALS